MELDKIFEDNYNAYSTINHGRYTVENMPTMNKEKFIETVEQIVKNINNDAVLYTGAFMQYLINVGIRSLEYNYDDKVIFDNMEYFKLCKEHNLSAYKALLFLQDYIDGDYVF